MTLAHALNDAGVEVRAGCHCATLAHQALGIDASCRLSFYLYNTVDEVDRAADALAAIVSTRRGAFLAVPRMASASDVDCENGTSQ